MVLLVIAVASDEVDQVTLREWDALLARQEILFEDIDHPLAARLRLAGKDCAELKEPPGGRDDVAVVVEPNSMLLEQLALEGAEVMTGSASLPDALTAARVAPVGRRVASSLTRVAGIMARLRGPQGCPWDAEQTHESLRVHLIEEAYEVLDAIDAGTVGPELEEELGDILLQVAFHCVIAQEDGRFDLASVADRLSAKLVSRHPHVFGDVVVSGAADVVGNWESLKQQEKARTGPFDGIPQGLPALLAAYKTQKRAASLGFAPDADLAGRRVTEGVEGAVDPDGLGDLLFWVVALARAHGIDPEGALRAATTRFQKTHA